MLNFKVSVLIPVYNSEKFLKESIESVLNQTYSELEIIAINDGSTDHSYDILREFQNEIKIINQKNEGLASALNRGIDAMTGNWFKWFSPDDVMYPDALKVLVESVQNLDNNTIVYSNWDIINEKGKKIRSFCESNYNHLNVFDFNVRLLDGQQINVNTSLAPKSLFENGLKINSKIDPVMVDYDFFLRAGIMHNTKFYLNQNSLIKYRIHGNQLSHQKIMDSIKNLDSTRKEILSNLETEKKEQYLNSLKIYQKAKPASQKSMETGLKIISNLLPNFVTDKILLFYLNKIRKNR